MHVSLIPGLRDRLIAEMDASRIPADKRVKYLTTLTGRAVPSTMRWIDDEKPGLPDLQSFADLCLRFDSDANYLLGLIPDRFSLPKMAGHDEAWVDYVRQKLDEQPEDCEMLPMVGDDMAPRIPNGAPMWVDRNVTSIQESGTYLLEFQGRTLVRDVEIRVGDGLALTCENPRFKPTIVKDSVAAKKMGLRTLGRICMVLKADKP